MAWACCQRRPPLCREASRRLACNAGGMHVCGETVLMLAQSCNAGGRRRHAQTTPRHRGAHMRQAPTVSSVASTRM